MAGTSALRVDPEREQRELQAYLGGAYDHAQLQDWERQLDKEFAGSGEDEAWFYRNSQGYLYNLTAFAMSGTKLPYLERLTELVPPGSRLLDYGCGIGSDGLALLEAGYRVEFADFDNPSAAFLRWRLRERGLQAPVHDLDQGVPSGFDAAYAFDVIEHVEDPFQFLAEMEQRAELVVVNLLEPDPGETELHHALPIGALLRRVANHRLRAYRVYYGRSHLLAYSPSPVGPSARLVTRVRIASSRLARTARALLARTARALRAGPARD